LTGIACTDEIAKWNSGTKRNVEPRPLSHTCSLKNQNWERIDLTVRMKLMYQGLVIHRHS
jgi:hypothetical protein